MEIKNSINAYVCYNLHSTVTKHVVEGTTPMMILCPTCNAVATSKMGMVNQKLKPEYEWYKPTMKEIESEAINASLQSGAVLDDILGGMIEHVLKGGLLMRKINQ